MIRIVKRCVFGLILIILSSHSINAFSQNLSVTDVCILSPDKYQQYGITDKEISADFALFAIKTPKIENIDFWNKNQYMDIANYKDGIYFVKMPPSFYRLSFRHENYLPGEIDIRTSFGYKAKAGKVYLITIENDKEENNSTLCFRISPATSGEIWLNNVPYSINNEGLVNVSVKKGQYTYVFRSHNFENAYGHIQIEKDIHTENVIVLPKMKKTTIDVSEALVSVDHNADNDLDGRVSNVSDALVYVDNNLYGTVGELNLPYGVHKIRISKQGYLDFIEEYVIDENFTPLNVELRKNNGKEVHIHSIQVKVNFSPLYINNKLVSDHNYGGTINLMPNKKYFIGREPRTGHVLKTGNQSGHLKLDGNKWVIIPF